MHERALRDTRFVYDHEDHGDVAPEPEPTDARGAVTIQEDSRGRRREIADWGGDELFGGRVARRRFSRAGIRPEDHAAPPHASGAPARHPGERPSGRFTRAEERRGGPEPSEAGETPTDDVAAGRFRGPAPAPALAGETPTDDVAAGRFRRPAAGRSQAGHGPTPVSGRRTVRIGGAPDDAMPAAPPRRRRPPRTVHERVGASPDRIAAWAFALGLVLILIAIVTAGGLG